MPAPPPPRPRADTIKILGFVLGIAIAAGLFAFHSALLIPPPPSSFGGTTDPAQVAYRNTVRALGWTAAALLDLSVGISVIAAWSAASSRDGLSDATRRGLFIFAAVFFLVWLVFSASVFSFFRYA